MTPGHRQRGKGTEGIDDANSLLGIGYRHVTTMLNGERGIRVKQYHILEHDGRTHRMRTIAQYSRIEGSDSFASTLPGRIEYNNTQVIS